MPPGLGQTAYGIDFEIVVAVVAVLGQVEGRLALPNLKDAPVEGENGVGGDGDEAAAVAGPAVVEDVEGENENAGVDEEHEGEDERGNGDARGAMMDAASEPTSAAAVALVVDELSLGVGADAREDARGEDEDAYGGDA